MKKKAKFSNGTTIQYDEATGDVKIAQSNHQPTMPLDVVDEQDRVEEGETRLDIPRDESVGLKQTHPKEVTVYKYKFELGDNGSDTSVVPRSTDDGVGGRKVTFEPEKADGYSSGDSDTYVQTLQDRPAPTPSGDSRNHAVVANNEIMTRIANLEKELKEAKKALNEEKLARGREKYARKIVQMEVDKGFFKPASEDDVEIKVANMIKNPIDVLENDLTRVQSLPSITANSNSITTNASRTIKTGFEAYSGLLQTGAASLTSTNVPTASSMRELHMAESGENLTQKIQRNTRLGAMYSDENIENYKNSDPRRQY